MSLFSIRAFFVLVSSAVGYYIGTLFDLPKPFMGLESPTVGIFLGFGGGLILVLLEMRLKKVSLSGLSSIVFGLLFGLFLVKLVSGILALLPLGAFFISVTELILTLIFCYLGVVIAFQGRDEFNIVIPYVRFKRQDLRDEIVLLDTSALVDGRILEICKSKFLEERLFVPRFVLQELQALADSENELKRQRGRRGLELIQNIQRNEHIDLTIHEDSMGLNGAVDEKLTQMAKRLDAGICTTDFNLTQTASIQGIKVLNVHTLAEALKRNILKGDTFDLKLSEKGKESDQAVGYLEDGTMVVVSGAREAIGQVKSVTVTSILPTQAGRMVFAKLANGKN